MSLKLKIFSMTLACLLLGSTLIAGPLAQVKANKNEALLTYKGQGQLDIELIARYTSGADFAEGGTEIVANNKTYNQLYSVNGADKAIDIISLSSQSDLTRIQIIATNDIHSRVLEGEGMGYAKIATIVEQYTSLNPNTIVLDAGDTFHGQTYSTLVEGESIVDLMNIIGYDAMTTGNHDYNYGYDRLLKLEKKANFSILAANVLDKDGEYAFDPYIIKKVDGILIGIFGIATPETLHKTHPKNVESLQFTDPVTAIKQVVAELKPQVDILINLAHLGTDGSTLDVNRADVVTRNVDGVDVIIDGHSHELINHTINDTLHVQFGEYGKQIGIITLEFNAEKELINKEVTTITADDAKTLPAHPTVAKTITLTTEKQKLMLNEVIANTATKLDGDRAIVRTGESNLGNLITDAMVYATGADIALTNGGGIRASIDVGQITIGDVITVLPFGNFIVTIEVTGQELKDALEVGATGYPSAHGAFAHVSGITYTINESKTIGNRIENVVVNGSPLNLENTYTLATNDFLAAGGDNYTMFADNTIINNASSLDDALITYMKHLGTVDAKLENRIMVNNLPSNNNVDLDDTDLPTSATNPETNGVHVVVKGDTLYHIAKKYNTTWRTLQTINKLKHPHLIYPGQIINLFE